MRVVVTGAAGIVGQAVLELLEGSGFEVISVIRRKSTPRYAHAISIDLTAEPLADRVDRADVVVHLAAALAQNSRYQDDSTSGLLTKAIDDNVLSYAEEVGAKVIYASTCSIYSARDRSWKSEDAKVVAGSKYQEAKLKAEHRLLDHPNACVFRLSAPYGPGLFASTVLGRFVGLARQDATIEVWGNGTREQDFIHSSDIAQFVLTAIRQDATGVYNVTWGQPVTMDSLAWLVVAVLGKGGVVRSGLLDPQEGFSARYLNNKAFADLGWVPRVSLSEGILALKGGSLRT